MSAISDRTAVLHYETVADTGHAYTQFHGWTLTCTSCGWETRAATKGEALLRMQAHYDDVSPKPGVVVRA